jgi:succinyl-CoA synthetase beta subunit
MNFDDNAEFRQETLFALRDKSQENPKEVAASEADLSYVQLDGTIGCMVNGAGLAMATMDLLTYHGGCPANFLDFQGAITLNKVEEAFKIVTSDERVRVIYINIFGGIARCDDIVKGIIAVADKIDLKVPVVARLQGTNVNEAKELIKNSNIKIIPQDDFNDSAELAVKVAKVVEQAHCLNLDIFLALRDESLRIDCNPPKPKPKAPVCGSDGKIKKE